MISFSSTNVLSCFCFLYKSAFSLWELNKCFFILFSVLNVFWQTGHGTFWSASWTPRTCSLRWPFVVNDLLHCSQLNKVGFSTPTPWILVWCTRRDENVLKCFSQTPHLYAWIPKCLRICCMKRHICLNRASHMQHLRSGTLAPVGAWFTCKKISLSSLKKMLWMGHVTCP